LIGLKVFEQGGSFQGKIFIDMFNPFLERYFIPFQIMFPNVNKGSCDLVTPRIGN
jgi:hypothetical protein